MRRQPPRLTVVAVCAGFALLTVACVASAAAPPGVPAIAEVSSSPAAIRVQGDGPIDPDLGINNITHVIVVVQENRSFGPLLRHVPGCGRVPARR